MRTLANLLITFLGLSAIGAAQSQEWKLVESTEDNFMLAAPAPLMFKRHKFLGVFIGGRGEYSDGKTYLYVFADSRRDRDQVEMVDRFLGANSASPEKVRVGHADGARYRFVDDDGYHHTIVRAVTGDRSLAFHALSREADNPLVNKFIESVRVSSSPFTDNERESVLPTNSGGEIPSDSSGLANPSTTTTTIRDTAPQPKAVDPRISPLRILSKVKAKYTDLARFYSIEGAVVVRVAFMSDGTVGEISVIRGLPFGLNATAKAAAKQFRFEPETFEGKPRNVSRPVHYEFDIY